MVGTLGEVFLNGLEGRAVAGQAVDRGGFEKIAGLFLVGELLVVEEPVVDTIDLAGPRLAGGGGHGDPDAGMVLAQDVLDGSLPTPAGPVRTTRRLRGVPSSSGVAAARPGSAAVMR